MQPTLQVNDSTSDQLPSTTTESTNSVQQAGGSEGLGAPAQPTTTSAAEQQELMNFLRSESAGPAHDTTTSSSSAGRVFIRLGVGTLVVCVVIVLALLLQQQLDRLNKS